jgi:hypothetical protein
MMGDDEEAVQNPEMKKQYKSPNVAVGTVKKSMARLLRGGCAERFDSVAPAQGVSMPVVSSGRWCAQKRRTQASRARHESEEHPNSGSQPPSGKSVPELPSRPAFAQETFSPSRASASTRRSWPRCHRTTVSGVTRISDCFHEDQKRCAITQNNLSTKVSLGRGCLRLRTISCCRNAKFSMRRLRRE